MNALYPPSPANSADDLVKASPAYRRQAWLAMFVLLAFMACYVLFSGWLAWKSYSLLRAGMLAGHNSVLLFGVGLGAAFLAVFMLKALVFVRRGQMGDLTEITAAEHPQLFAFLARLVAEAKAPTPAKVYLSSRVNAAVFYDLSPLNLLFPSKKNLEIGLPLVNVLSLSEFKAVLAHELGHFAQRSMAVGRWVYLAQQIAAHIVGKRDMLDRFLAGLTRLDIRIAWIGWLFMLLVWSIRSVVDSFFRLVVLAERALSREMEFQADRVSVSLAGSDALIDALYKLQAADTAWDRTIDFCNAQLRVGKAAPDLYDIQSAIAQKLRVIFADPGYGLPPPAPVDGAATHRIFRRDSVSVSRMWATHPPSYEREDNAKKIYLQVARQETSAWALFEQPEQLRRQMCAAMIAHVKPAPEVLSREAALAALDAEYARESYNRRYRGVYLARAVTRTQASVAQLIDNLTPEAASTALATLYPESLSADLTTLEGLQHERGALVAVQDGIASARDKQLQHRGKPIKKRQLAAAIAEVTADIAAIESSLAAQDRRCRSCARALAAAQGGAWEASWLAQFQLLHYAEHTQANLLDLHGLLANTVAMVTAKRKVSDAEVWRTLDHAGKLYDAMAEVAKQAPNLQPGAQALALLGAESWTANLGAFELLGPTRENLSNWINVIDGWVQPMLRALNNLRRAALDQLLLTEARLFDAAISQQPLGEAPAAPVVPTGYATLLAGQERPRQKKLDAWSRFQTADGWWAWVARLGVAGSIVGVLLGFGVALGMSSVVAFNGLDRTVSVHVDDATAQLTPGASHVFQVAADRPLAIRAETQTGDIIEAFSADAELIGAHYVYNVASASPLIAWTATYGSAVAKPEQLLGAPRWSLQSADYIFESPPTQISSKSGGGTRSALSAPDSRAVEAYLGALPAQDEQARLIEAHATWDEGDSANLLQWLAIAQQALPDRHALIVQQRLQRAPLELMALRAEQDGATAPDDYARVCAKGRELAQAHPDSGDLAYLVIRCIADQPARDAAFKTGFQQHPDNAWFGYAAGLTWLGEQDWAAARRAFEVAFTARYLAGFVAVDLARIRRVEQGEGAAIDDLVAGSDYLKRQQVLQTGQGIPVANPLNGYQALAKGDLGKTSEYTRNPTDVDQFRLALLVGASDGADDAQVARALEVMRNQTPTDYDASWAAIGLGIKHAQPIDPLLGVLAQVPDSEAQGLRAFIEVLKTTRDTRQAEAALVGVRLQLRAQAYVAGLIVLGSEAPAAWRTLVLRALFPAERPWFAH
ncbi:MAG: M48 family metallopeptidase [Nevskiaceae bacterium]|jgi:Zn-dependent protease with chaperone function|nr:M48 family metallopeptidase [Nevskiaceae bacterium]